MTQTNPYTDLFDELKKQVRDAGLLERVPVRGTIEMIAIIVSIIVALSTAPYWHPVLLAIFLTIILNL